MQCIHPYMHLPSDDPAYRVCSAKLALLLLLLLWYQQKSRLLYSAYSAYLLAYLAGYLRKQKEGRYLRQHLWVCV